MLILLASQAGLGSFLINTIVMSLVLLGAAYLLSGVTINSFTSAVIVAVVLGLLNATIGRFMHFIFTPITWLTLGIFSFVIDALVLRLTAYFLKGFQIKSFGWAFLLAIFVSLANVLLHFQG
ncbi:MAG: phage holin family protein [Bacteroidota bacterium]